MTCWGQRKAPGFWSLKLKKLALRADKDIKIKGQIYPTTSSVIPIYPVGRQSEGSPT